MPVEVTIQPGTAFRVKGEPNRIEIVVRTIEENGNYAFSSSTLNYDNEGNAYLYRFGTGGAKNIEEIIEEKMMTKEEVLEAIERGWLIRTEGKAPFEGGIEEAALEAINTPPIRINY